MASPEENHELDLLLPASVTGRCGGRCCAIFAIASSRKNFRHCNSLRPVNTGMLIGDAVSLPWYRTVFTNLGNVINPEVLPPLELESRPVDVGELVSDQMGTCGGVRCCAAWQIGSRPNVFLLCN
jgi:hypothetical protein